MRFNGALALVGALAFASPALAQGYNAFGNGPPQSYQTFSHSLTHTPDRGSYNQQLGTSQHGIPAEAQAQAGASPAPDPYDQWDYTGWGGLTQGKNEGGGLNGRWSVANGHYVQAIPPGRD